MRIAHNQVIYEVAIKQCLLSVLNISVTSGLGILLIMRCFNASLNYLDCSKHMDMTLFYDEFIDQPFVETTKRVNSRSSAAVQI